jgi:lipopolysaccharide biosynthesis regulator YciM
VIEPLQRFLVFTRDLAHGLGLRAVPATELDTLRRRRDTAVESGQWGAALEPAERIAAAASTLERAGDVEWVAVIHYELGREEMGRGHLAAAAAQFRSAVKADRHFVPATLALGDALEASGDRREAVRTWERAVEASPTLPVLARLERAYRDEGRPSRMIALYRAAAERAPDDLALAVELGRVYFDLEMLDEAADQFEKIEVRAPDLPVVHAYLGAVFEHRGDTADAFAEYRRALRLGHSFVVPYRCTACGAAAERWQDRCPGCRRWNTIRPMSRP